MGNKHVKCIAMTEVHYDSVNFSSLAAIKFIADKNDIWFNASDIDYAYKQIGLEYGANTNRVWESKFANASNTSRVIVIPDGINVDKSIDPRYVHYELVMQDAIHRYHMFTKHEPNLYLEQMMIKFILTLESVRIEGNLSEDPDQIKKIEYQINRMMTVEEEESVTDEVAPA